MDQDFLSAHAIDMRAVMLEINGLPAEQRLPALLWRAGCRFHENDVRMVAAPAVRLSALGGLPLHALAASGLSAEDLADLTTQTMAVSGAMSYLSLPGGGLETAYDTVVGVHGHTSVAHTTTVSLLVAGVSCAVENEFNSQRDLAHLSRITEARTAVQSRPSLIVPDAALVGGYRRILAVIDAERAALAEGMGAAARTRAALERLNLMYPASKATAFVLTASLRNLQKLLAAENDPGKEDEYRAALGLIREPLARLWPSLFQANAPIVDDTPEPAAPRR